MSESIEAIRTFIKENHYTYFIGDIFRVYRNYYKRGYYCSYSANHVISENIHHFKVIENYFRKKNK